MPHRRILIDGDILVVRACSALEKAIEWEPGIVTYHTNVEEAKKVVNGYISSFCERLEADSFQVFISPKKNFRYDILPTYKSNRKSTRRPLGIPEIKHWLIEHFDAKFVKGLEADDLIGITATQPTKQERIIVSLDKDFKTIPGKLCIFTDEDDDGNPVVQDISEDSANRWHMIQTLAGDVVDGYVGCPGVGMDKAQKALDEGYRLEAYQHEFIRGPRKGQTETRYDKVPCNDPWQIVVSQFEAAGLTEEDALVQARVARICRFEDYNPKTKEPILWQPQPNATTAAYSRHIHAPTMRRLRAA